MDMKISSALNLMFRDRRIMSLNQNRVSEIWKTKYPISTTTDRNGNSSPRGAGPISTKLNSITSPGKMFSWMLPLGSIGWSTLITNVYLIIFGNSFCVHSQLFCWRMSRMLYSWQYWSLQKNNDIFAVPRYLPANWNAKCLLYGRILNYQSSLTVCALVGFSIVLEETDVGIALHI
jgi:hypothetical protein